MGGSSTGENVKAMEGATKGCVYTFRLLWSSADVVYFIKA
jgi:hypothetical protein